MILFCIHYWIQYGPSDLDCQMDPVRARTSQGSGRSPNLGEVVGDATGQGPRRSWARRRATSAQRASSTCEAYSSGGMSSRMRAAARKTMDRRESLRDRSIQYEISRSALQSATDPQLKSFIDKYADGSKAPEPRGECTGGIGTPQSR